MTAIPLMHRVAAIERPNTPEGHVYFVEALIDNTWYFVLDVGAQPLMYHSKKHATMIAAELDRQRAVKHDVA